MYCDNLQQLLDNPDLLQSKGVKFDSEFNKFTYFKAFEPGFPPCIAHDLF